MKFREKFQQFMYGRYGIDEFSKTLIYTSLGMMILHTIFKIPAINTLGMLVLIYCYFRIFSRNIYKRAAENQKYLQIKDLFLQKFLDKKGSFTHARQSKDHRIFKCPTCKQKVRVPKGKGKIKIHCPRCHGDFVKKT